MDSPVFLRRLIGIKVSLVKGPFIEAPFYHALPAQFPDL
jgi:hypothetical protein